MSATTIQIPGDQVDALRQSLIDRRQALEESRAGAHGRGSAPLGVAEEASMDEIDRLIEQLESDDREASESRQLTGSHRALWGAVYDVTCAAAEALADECNDYWRGSGDPAPARSGIAAVSARLDLLEGLGPPPGD